MTLAAPTHQQTYNGRGSQANKCSSRLKTAYSGRKGAPTEEWFLWLFALKRREMAPPGPTKAFYSQPRQPACAITWRVTPAHLSPIPPFLLAQNLSSKQIAVKFARCVLIISSWKERGVSEATGYRLQQLEYKHILRKGKWFPGTSCSVCVLPVNHSPFIWLPYQLFLPH